MRDPEPVVTLDCSHVELRDGRCATTDCVNFVGVDGIDPWWNYRD